jgi:hypothetical protein
MRTPDMPSDDDDELPIDGLLFQRATYDLFRHQHECTPSSGVEAEREVRP